MDRRRPKPIRRGWNYIPDKVVQQQQSIIPESWIQHIPKEEVSTTPWYAARALEVLVSFYAVIELVIFYAVVNTTALLTEVLNYSSKVVWYAVNFSYHVARYAVQKVGQQNTPPKKKVKVEVKPTEVVQIPVNITPTEAIQLPVPEVKPMPKPTPPELVQIPVVPKEDNKVEVNKVEVNKVEFNEVEVKPTEVIQIPVNITPTEFVPEVTVKPTETVQIPVPKEIVPKEEVKPTILSATLTTIFLRNPNLRSLS